MCWGLVYLWQTNFNHWADGLWREIIYWNSKCKVITIQESADHWWSDRDCTLRNAKLSRRPCNCSRWGKRDHKYTNTNWNWRTSYCRKTQWTNRTSRTRTSRTRTSHINTWHKRIEEFWFPDLFTDYNHFPSSCCNHMYCPQVCKVVARFQEERAKNGEGAKLICQTWYWSRCNLK